MKIKIIGLMLLILAALTLYLVSLIAARLDTASKVERFNIYIHTGTEAQR